MTFFTDHSDLVKDGQCSGFGGVPNCRRRSQTISDHQILSTKFRSLKRGAVGH